MPFLLLFSILAVAALVTSFISGILGMAGGMILMGILLAVLPVPAAMMLHGITQLASNAWRAWLWRTSVDWRVFRGYAYGTIVALAFFVAVQILVSKPAALIILGLTPFVGLALPESLKLNVERRGHSFACGLICQGLNLTAGVSGPILDVFFVRSAMGRHAVVATKALTQSLSHTVKIAYFGGIAATAAGSNVHVGIAATMVVLAFVGTTLSRSVLEKMNDTSFRLWTKWTVLSLGVVYLASGALLLAEA
ncbi:TSUP family transporter [Usitatibacter palustris]|nr:TSUP family transporter [Usitatibacter palustris]